MEASNLVASFKSYFSRGARYLIFSILVRHVPHQALLGFGPTTKQP